MRTDVLCDPHLVSLRLRCLGKYFSNLLNVKQQLIHQSENPLEEGCFWALVVRVTLFLRACVCVCVFFPSDGWSRWWDAFTQGRAIKGLLHNSGRSKPAEPDEGTSDEENNIRQKKSSTAHTISTQTLKVRYKMRKASAKCVSLCVRFCRPAVRPWYSRKVDKRERARVGEG